MEIARAISRQKDILGGDYSGDALTLSLSQRERELFKGLYYGER